MEPLDDKKLLFMLGGTLGNLNKDVDVFLEDVAHLMSPGDVFVLDTATKGEEYDTQSDYFRDFETFPDSMKRFFRKAVEKMRGNGHTERKPLSDLIEFDDFKENDVFDGFKLIDKETKGTIIPIKRYDFEKLKEIIEDSSLAINGIVKEWVIEGVVQRTTIICTKV